MAAAPCGQRESNGVSGTAVYQRRQLERSVVYQILQGHLQTWLAGCRQADEASSAVADSIEQDFRKYLACGILAHGCARARCAGCGYDFLIAMGVLEILCQFVNLQHTAVWRIDDEREI